jgi:hypothetical protein
MSLQQAYSLPSGQFGRRLPATASVRAADELLRRLEPSTSDRIRSPYGESRLNREPPPLGLLQDLETFRLRGQRSRRRYALLMLGLHSDLILNRPAPT